MTPHSNSETTGAREATPQHGELSGESRVVLQDRLRRMADEVELLQIEIAAVEAFVTDPDPHPESALPAPRSARPGAGWTPTPTPQPWLDRSA